MDEKILQITESVLVSIKISTRTNQKTIGPLVKVLGFGRPAKPEGAGDRRVKDKLV